MLYKDKKTQAYKRSANCIIPQKSAYTSIGDCMRNKTGLQWCGFAFVSIVGTLWHFIYQWTGDNRLVCPVNERPWEHLKLLWFPFLLWCLINLRSTMGQSGAWARHCVGAITGIGVITALFFTYKGIIGRDVMALDIMSFILGVGNAFWIADTQRQTTRKKRTNRRCFPTPGSQCAVYVIYFLPAENPLVLRRTKRDLRHLALCQSAIDGRQVFTHIFRTMRV